MSIRQICKSPKQFSTATLERRSKRSWHYLAVTIIITASLIVILGTALASAAAVIPAAGG